jgi:hypothetical protein
MMTVGELRNYLNQLDPNDEVLVASQPQYPIRENIVCVRGPLPGEEDIIWLATEQDYNKPYAPSGAWG